MSGRNKDMRSYWNERASQNAPWYVDTSLQYEQPDMDQFFETGRRIVSYAFDDVPVAPATYGTALEIGSGLGRVCLALSERFDNILGVDIAPEMTARARQLVPDSRIAFVVGDGSSLGVVRSASVDAVFSFTVFQHIPSIPVIERYIEEAGRVLKPGGMFVFQWNNIPGSWRWAARRKILSAVRHLPLMRDPTERDAPAFLGSRVSLRRIEGAVERGNMDIRHTKGLGTLYGFAWAVRRS